MEWEVVKLKKYEMYDLFKKRKKIIGHANDLEEVKKIAIEYNKKTNGKCQMWISELNENGKYNYKERMFIATWIMYNMAKYVKNKKMKR